MSRFTLAAAAAGLAFSLSGAPALAQDPAATTPNDYSKPETWLCWPGRADACAIDNTTTVVKADGSMSRETWKADPKAPVDCFYVYPTVSNDPGVLSDMTPNAEERRVVEQQLARFGAKCRVYAPMYRQVTLTALRAAMTPGAKPPATRPTTNYDDVRDAWNYYLTHENKGRGVVLIGHSQGAGLLTELIAREIDGKPARDRLVSALLLGTNLPVEKGKDVGTYKTIPLCKSADQFGCALAYVSFRDTVPPPANSRFGVPREPNPAMEAACVNPAALGGGKGELHAYLSSGAMIAADAAPPPAWVKGGADIKTPFVSVPGLLTGECVSKDGFNYLAVHINADPNDPRTDDIAGDVKVGPMTLTDWGLHLIDVNLAMGDLVDLVGSQSQAYLARK
ncbi:MAG: lysophospholipase [Kaistia sp. SCN 65-12]|nr:MAG: lysophospholipase [Kaistia sp. SCN 65-12]